MMCVVSGMINTLVSRASSLHVLDDVLEMLRARRLVVDVTNCPIQRPEYTTHSNTDQPCQIYTLPPNNTYSGGITFSGMPSGCPSVRPLSVVNTYLARRDISLLSEGILMKPVTNLYHMMGIAEKVSKVRGQGHNQTECYNGRGRPFDGAFVASTLTLCSSGFLCGFTCDSLEI